MTGLNVLEQILERPSPRVLPQVLIHHEQGSRRESVSDSSDQHIRESNAAFVFKLPTDLHEIEAELQVRHNERGEDLLSAEASMMR